MLNHPTDESEPFEKDMSLIKAALLSDTLNSVLGMLCANEKAYPAITHRHVFALSVFGGALKFSLAMIEARAEAFMEKFG